MKVFSYVMWLLQKAKSFQSESLDNLAEVMRVTKILKKSKLDRYYKVRSFQGASASLDRVFFDAKYLQTLLPDEVLAVGAHEFTHLNQRHGIKKFLRLLLPPMIIGSMIGGVIYFNFVKIDHWLFVSLGKDLSSLCAGAFSCLVVSIAGFYVNAKWLRQQETVCDLSSVKFLNGESMVSALIKLDELRPHKMGRLASLLLPQVYPTLEQRISDIRKAIGEKTENSLPPSNQLL